MDVTLEEVVARLKVLEAAFAEQQRDQADAKRKDWRRVVGMFTGSEFMPEVDAAGAAIRDAEVGEEQP